jgi:hypothetical protein
LPLHHLTKRRTKKLRAFYPLFSRDRKAGRMISKLITTEKKEEAHGISDLLLL